MVHMVNIAPICQSRLQPDRAASVAVVLLINLLVCKMSENGDSQTAKDVQFTLKTEKNSLSKTQKSWNQVLFSIFSL